MSGRVPYGTTIATARKLLATQAATIRGLTAERDGLRMALDERNEGVRP